MNSGVVGAIAGDPERLGSFVDTVERNGFELARGVDVERIFSLPDGTHAVAGKAAVDRITDVETAEIAPDGITTRREETTVTAYTSFLMVPGEFIAVDSSDGTFAFDLVADETNALIDRARFDIDEFLDAHRKADRWKYGYYGAGNGVLYGDPVIEQADLASVPSAAHANQVGLEYDRDGDRVKMTLTESGYVAVYRPATYDDGAFLQYLADEILPHAATST